MASGGDADGNLRASVSDLKVGVHQCEAFREPEVGPVVATNLRFRQAVGVGVRLKMEELGWAKTGVKGPLVSANFSRAERYVAV